MDNKLLGFPETLKGLDHQTNIFVKAYKIKSVVSVYAQIVFKLLACIIEEKNNYKISACFLENIY